MKKTEKPLMSPKPVMPTVTDKVFLDISVDDELQGRIVIGLFGADLPRTAENFKQLCACDAGKGKLSGIDLCYKGTTIHRIIPNFLIQAGDFTHHNGVGGESIYGGHFEDESFDILHNKRYLVAMANAGKPHTNGSQFFINTVKTSWLDGKNVVFGTVLEGMKIIDDLEHLGTNSGVPKKKINIIDSGVISKMS